MAGVTPMKSVGAARYMKNKVPGMDVPDEVVETHGQRTPKEKQAQEGIDICVETIQRLEDRRRGRISHHGHRVGARSRRSSNGPGSIPAFGS
jgi:hypothetical protein